MILEELGRNPPDVTLDQIVKELLSFFNGFECLHEAKRMIEKKCAIKKEPEHKCWSEHYIKQAWKETIKENIKSSTRRHWARVIILQIVKSFVCDTCKQNAAQKNRDATTDEQCCDMRRNPEDRSSQSKAELETVGAAGGVEQMFGAGKKVSKLTEDSGVASERELSAFSTDEAPSPAAVYSNSEARNAALVNENEDTLVKNCEQQTDIAYYELPVADVHDKENVRLKNGLWSIVKQECGKAQRMKKNSEHRSAQINVAAPGEEQTNNQQTNRNQGQTGSVSQGQTGTPYPGAPDDQSGTDVSAASERGTKRRRVKTTYIRIPLSEVFGNESPSTTRKAAKNVYSEYKLIDLPPEDESEKIKKKRFYVMSYNNDNKTPKWVYEIMNKSTLPSYYKKPEFKDSDSDSGSDSNDPSYKPYKRSNSFESPNYERGHLAAAANHTWCQEAYEETYWMRNITPQHKSLNRGTWKKLEEYCRKKILINKVNNVHVYTGPLYLNKKSETVGGKAVPSHYFKVVIVEEEGGKVELECYEIPNEKSESEKKDNKEQTEENENNEENTENNWLERYKVDIEDIQEKSGLKFIKDCPELTKDHKRTATWRGNKGKKSVTIDVTISSCEKNDEDPQGLNEE